MLPWPATKSTGTDEGSSTMVNERLRASRNPLGSFNLPWLVRGQERRWDKTATSHWAASSRREWVAQSEELVKDTSREQMSRAWLRSFSKWGPHSSAKVELRTVVLHNSKAAPVMGLEYSEEEEGGN